jgi:hypothetical protein
MDEIENMYEVSTENEWCTIVKKSSLETANTLLYTYSELRSVSGVYDRSVITLYSGLGVCYGYAFYDRSKLRDMLDRLLDPTKKDDTVDIFDDLILNDDVVFNPFKNSVRGWFRTKSCFTELNNFSIKRNGLIGRPKKVKKSTGLSKRMTAHIRGWLSSKMNQRITKDYKIGLKVWYSDRESQNSLVAMYTSLGYDRMELYKEYKSILGYSHVPWRNASSTLDNKEIKILTNQAAKYAKDFLYQKLKESKNCI